MKTKEEEEEEEMIKFVVFLLLSILHFSDICLQKTQHILIWCMVIPLGPHSVYT